MRVVAGSARGITLETIEGLANKTHDGPCQRGFVQYVA